MKLWFRFLFKSLILTFLFLLLALFALYALVDLSLNGAKFDASWISTFTYYLCHFSDHFDLFASLALLLASFRVLFEVNSRNELVSLLMAGLSQRRLLSPFLTLALLITLLSYANAEFLLPHARDHLLSYRATHASKQTQPTPLFAQPLPDQSTLVYRRYDAPSRRLLDLYWIRSPEDIWALQELDLSTTPPRGAWVDHFTRTPLLTKTESYDELFFFDLPTELLREPDRFRPLDSRSISTLLREMPTLANRTHLHNKLTRPLLSPTLLFALLPFALTFSRTKRLIIPLALSLLAWIGLLVILDSALILSENQLIPPFTLFLPYLALLLLSKRAQK